MDWQAIGATGEVIGALAVVLTLVYLSREVRHSTEAAHIAAYHQAQQQLWSAAETIAADRELADIIARTIRGGIGALPPADRVRLEFVMGSFFFGMESMLALSEKGHIKQELWQNVLDNNMQLVGSPLGREVLRSRPGALSRRLEAIVAGYSR